jgi:hypothetical protein
MRKPPSSDPDRATRPVPVTPDPAASAAPVPETAPPAPDAPAGDASGPPSLIWPPAEDELKDWEVLHLHSTGQTVIEPMKYVPPGGARTDAPRSGERPIPAAPAPYVPPPIDDPVGEASLRPTSSDFNLPETELIEPLTVVHEFPHAALPATTPYLPPSGARPVAVPAPASEPMPDERTVMIPRPQFGAPRHEPRREPSDETNPGASATRILVAPKFAATVGHMPTVPVSALHRSEMQPPKPASPRNPLEETLPAGITREQLFAPEPTPGTGTADDTATVRPSQADTHPVPIAVPKAAPAPGSGEQPSPFSRVASRAPQPVVAASPEPARATSAPVPPAAPAVPVTPYGAPIPTRRAAASPLARVLVLGLVVALAVAVALGAYWYLSERTPAAAALAPATLSIDSSPAGAAVSIDGTPRGKTPLRLELTEGAHTLDVTHDGATKHIPLTLAAGTVTAHSLEFVAPAAAGAAAADAAIEVRSDPAGGRVLVDGIERGKTPIVVTGLTSGRHEVQVSGPFRTLTKTVTLAPKQQYRLVVAPARVAEDTPEPRGARASSETGYIAIQSPIVLRIVRNGDFVGTSEDTRLALPVGSHVIGLENESVGYRDVRTVEVAAGKVTSVPVTLPNGAISINARPWAEVFVDGQRVGETPVSQFSLPVGIHEILFRHPELGERTVSVVVKLGTTGRAFTDFTK